MSSVPDSLPPSSPSAENNDAAVPDDGGTADPAEVDATGLRLQVRLSPSDDSNFVIHYRSTDFHVHSLVLRTHSTYFRTYLSALQPLKPVVTGKKRKTCSVDLSLADERRDKCDHSPLIRCITLPEKCGIAAASEAEFFLFLRHLYFSSTFHLPPWAPKAEIIAGLTDDTPVCLTFPIAPVDADDVALHAEEVEVGCGSWYWHVALLSLFHYFDCQAALERSEAAIISRVRVADTKANAWHWLPIVSRFKLKRAEAACVAVIGEDSSVRLADRTYGARLTKLSHANKNRVIAAFYSHPQP